MGERTDKIARIENQIAELQKALGDLEMPLGPEPVDLVLLTVQWAEFETWYDYVGVRTEHGWVMSGDTNKYSWKDVATKFRGALQVDVSSLKVNKTLTSYFRNES